MLFFYIFIKNCVCLKTSLAVHLETWCTYLTFEHDGGKLHLPLPRQLLGSHHLKVSCKPVLLLSTLHNSNPRDSKHAVIKCRHLVKDLIKSESQLHSWKQPSRRVTNSIQFHFHATTAQVFHTYVPLSPSSIICHQAV